MLKKKKNHKERPFVTQQVCSLLAIRQSRWLSEKKIYKYNSSFFI